MAAKKKTKKKATNLKKHAGKKAKPTKKRTQKRGTLGRAAKKTAAPSKAAKKNSAKKTASGKTTAASADARNVASNTETRTRNRGRRAGFSRDVAEPDSGGQSGDLQGLSNIERADSESVDELIEEGNAFEAGVVSGVEEAGESGEREVHTHQVPEDDVPEEYLDQDK